MAVRKKGYRPVTIEWDMPRVDNARSDEFLEKMISLNG